MNSYLYPCRYPLSHPNLDLYPVLPFVENSTSDVRLIRDGAIIYTGKVGTLFREKNQVKQVSNGQECGITIKEYMDFQKDDTIEAFDAISKERTI